MLNIPAEVQLFGLYLPPFLLIFLFGLIGALAISQVLNWTGLSRFFWHPGLAFVGFWVLLTSIIGLVFLPP